MILKAAVEIDYSEDSQEVRGVELVLPCGDHENICLDLSEFRTFKAGSYLPAVMSNDQEIADALWYMLRKHREELRVEQQLDYREMDK